MAVIDLYFFCDKLFCFLNNLKCCVATRNHFSNLPWKGCATEEIWMAV